MMSQDYKLGFRMLARFPGLTIAGGLALAIAIGVGAGWYDISRKLFAPEMPIPDGGRIVLIETRNVLTNETEPRVAHDFLEWRRGLRTITELGAYHAVRRNVTVGDAVPMTVQTADITASAFRAAHVAPIRGRGLLDTDDVPGAPFVAVIGYDLWQRAFMGRDAAIGSVVKVGATPATVVGVMPEGFTYPVNQVVWMPLQLRDSYAALEGGALSVIGRLAPGMTGSQANAELGVVGERTATVLAATHQHLRPRVVLPGGIAAVAGLTRLAISNGPALLVLLIACMNVGTLFYARTATREGEIAVRSALGASRRRIVGQMFVEALVLALVAAGVGLIAADRVLRWGMEQVTAPMGGPPFWATPGLELTTIVYAVSLAVVCAALLSLMPAIKATQRRVQSSLSNLGSGGSTLRFGRVWTTAMVAQVTLTAIAIPVAGESLHQMLRKQTMRADFASSEYVTAQADIDQTFADTGTRTFEERRGRVLAALQQRIAQEPGVVAMTFADQAPGAEPHTRVVDVETSLGGGPAFDDLVWTAAIGPGFFETFASRVIAGRDFDGRDRTGAANSVIVNEAFARRFTQASSISSPLGSRVRYEAPRGAPASPWREIVGIARDIGLDPEDRGPCCSEAPYVYQPATANTVTPFAMTIHVRGDAAGMVARLPNIAAAADSALRVEQAQTLRERLERRNRANLAPLWTLAAVTGLALFLSGLGLFSLTSVSVSRRTREIGLRAALGAGPREILASIFVRVGGLVGSGIVIGGLLLGLFGLTAGDDVSRAMFVAWLAITSTVMVIAGFLACVGPARRALRINPTEALRET